MKIPTGQKQFENCKQLKLNFLTYKQFENSCSGFNFIQKHGIKRKKNEQSVSSGNYDVKISIELKQIQMIAVIDNHCRLVRRPLLDECLLIFFKRTIF